MQVLETAPAIPPASRCLHHWPEAISDGVKSSGTFKSSPMSRYCTNNGFTNFHVLLTVQHLSILIWVINQLDAQNLFYGKFISCLYMFRAPCAHHQEVKIVLYSIWYHHTYRWPSGAQVERGRGPLSTCTLNGHLQVWWYQMLYNTILTSWRWAHGARNM